MFNPKPEVPVIIGYFTLSPNFCTCRQIQTPWLWLPFDLSTTLFLRSFLSNPINSRCLQYVELRGFKNIQVSLAFSRHQ